jgi:hypothetical protein
VKLNTHPPTVQMELYLNIPHTFSVYSLNTGATLETGMSVMRLRCQDSFCGFFFVEMTGGWTNVLLFCWNDWQLNNFFYCFVEITDSWTYIWLFCWNDWKLNKYFVLLKWLEVEHIFFFTVLLKWLEVEQFFALLLKLLKVEHIFDCFVEMTGSWTNVSFLRVRIEKKSTSLFHHIYLLCKTGELLKKFLWIFVIGSITKMCRHISVSVQSR